MPFTTLPADRPRAEAGVRAAYAAAGLPAPAHFLWVPSPAAGALLSVLLRPTLPPPLRTSLLTGIPTTNTRTSPPLPTTTSDTGAPSTPFLTNPLDPKNKQPLPPSTNPPEPSEGMPKEPSLRRDQHPGDTNTPARHGNTGTSARPGDIATSVQPEDANAPEQLGDAGASARPKNTSPSVRLWKADASVRLWKADASVWAGAGGELFAPLGEITVGASVRELVRTVPWERERAAAHAELGPRGWAEAWSRSGAFAWEQVNALVTRIRRAIGELGGEEHGALLRSATLDAVLGQHDTPWLELFDSLDRLEPLHGLAEVAASAGWWWPYENLVILSERPTELHRDEPGRLHNGAGPALAYPDGFALHSWRGMPIPPGFLDTLTGLTARRILGEDNAELRRVMLEHFGYDRYLSEIGARPLHKDETGVLWRIDLPGDEPVVMVEVVNSTPEPDGTHRTYYLRVPPNTLTARAGVAWTFGLTEQEYRPLKET